MKTQASVLKIRPRRAPDLGPPVEGQPVIPKVIQTDIPAEESESAPNYFVDLLRRQILSGNIERALMGKLIRISSLHPKWQAEIDFVVGQASLELSGFALAEKLFASALKLFEEANDVNRAREARMLQALAKVRR